MMSRWPAAACKHAVWSCLLVWAALLAGCHRDVLIPAKELHKLDGFQAGDRVVLQDEVGKFVLFTRTTPLTFAFDQGATRGGEFVAIKVDEEWFRGITQHGTAMSIALADIKEVKVHVFSPESTLEEIVKWIAAAVGATLILIAIVIILLIILLILVIIVIIFF